MLAFASSGPRFVFAAVVLSACAAAPDASTPVARQTPRVVHRMPTGSTSTASIQTLANATCELSAAGASGALRVFSDDAGIARIQLDHLDTRVRHGELQLDCVDGAGATDSTTLEVVIDDGVAPSQPQPFDRGGRPTLARDGHYPPRPGAADPAGLAAWQQLVASDPAVVAPNAIADDVRHSINTTSSNWSGYVLRSLSTAPIYAWIYGEWNVPRAYAESGFSSSDHSSLWVGIDGYGSNDVVQDGTDQNTLTVFWIQTSSYDAWFEWYPLSAQVLSSFPVNPGDRIHAWTVVTDANGNYSAQPTLGRFYLWNQTQNVFTSYAIGLPSGVTFNGHSAEWVMERPTVNGSVSSLANYNTAQLTSAQTYDLSGGSHQYAGDQSDTSFNVTMSNPQTLTVLSTVAPVNASTMQFTFHAHN